MLRVLASLKSNHETPLLSEAQAPLVSEVLMMRLPAFTRPEISRWVKVALLTATQVFPLLIVLKIPPPFVPAIKVIESMATRLVIFRLAKPLFFLIQYLS